MSVEEESSSPNGEGGDIEFTVAPDALKQAQWLENQGRYLEAVQAYNHILSKSPQNAQVWWRLGNCYVRLGRKDYAIHCFERVLKIKPGEARLRDWLGRYRSAPTPPPPLSP
jgi:tetratricopeptide (TPR) repeat protein